MTTKHPAIATIKKIWIIKYLFIIYLTYDGKKGFDLMIKNKSRPHAVVLIFWHPWTLKTCCRPTRNENLCQIYSKKGPANSKVLSRLIRSWQVGFHCSGLRYSTPLFLCLVFFYTSRKILNQTLTLTQALIRIWTLTLTMTLILTPTLTLPYDIISYLTLTQGYTLGADSDDCYTYLTLTLTSKFIKGGK